MTRAIRFGWMAPTILLPLISCSTPPTELSEHHAMAAHAPASLSASDLRKLRQATLRFKRQGVSHALSEGYAIFGGCFSDAELGGMGQHYANDPLINDPSIKLERPELLLYETNAEGKPHLVAVEYIVFVEDWEKAGNRAPPRLFNTDFHINSTLLPRPFYLLHVWVWKPNPKGLLADWNPKVVCRA